MKETSIIALENELQAFMKPENIIKNAPMKKYTSFKAGGHAGMLLLPETRSEVQMAIRCVKDAQEEYMLMGNGSDILVCDGGYPGVIIRMGEKMSGVAVGGTFLTAGAGTLMSVVAREALAAGLTGFEFASGIPGSIGGALFMNAGAYDGEMKHIVRSAEVMSPDGREIYTVDTADMELGYRHSRFQNSGEVILEVTMELCKGKSDDIAARMKELANKRNEKQPVNLPSAGSFFKRPEGHFAGKLIQDAGLKGLAVGDAQISPLHAGFIVNNGSASATDIISLMELVQNMVFEKSGVRLEPEVRIIGRR